MGRHTRMALWLSAVAMLVLVVGAVPALSQCGRAAQCPGPCGPKAGGASPESGQVSAPGQRHVCRHLSSFTMAYQGKTYPVEAIEAAEMVLIPERTLGVTGAQVEWLGGRESTVSLGSRTVHLTLGCPKVKITEGDKTTETTWALCPRVLGGVTYVPLRSVAEALGLAVEWEPGTVKLGPGEATAAATEAPADCPASRVEKALGITVVRGPVSSPFGPGLGVLAVDAGGRAAELGLQPQDVILACGDTPISCPRDLDAVIAKQQAEKQCVCKLTVARGQTKLTLQGSPKAQP